MDNIILKICVKEFLKTDEGRKMAEEVMSVIAEIKYIKSFGDPPLLKDDLYYHRHPWQKFGGVSSGICECWCWYCDEYIYSNTTAEDRQMAKEEMEKYYLNKEN